MKQILRKGDLVKKTKSAQLIALLERAGWQRETAGGIILPKDKEVVAINPKK